MDGGVEVGNGAGSLSCDGEARRPGKAFASLAMEVLRERAIGHELVEENLLASIHAAA